MAIRKSSPARWIVLFALWAAVLSFGQGKKLKDAHEEERDHPREREQWFRRGRPSDGGRAAEKLHRAYQQKLEKRAAQRRQALQANSVVKSSSAGGAATSGAAVPANGAMWVPLGPAPLASDASGAGSQDYGPATGRATAVAVDQNDATGGTVYVGGAYGGVWKSTNAANTTTSECGTLAGVRCAPNVVWRQLIDDQATLAVGAIAVKPGDSNVVLVGTGESNSSADSYYGLGILRSADAGNTWTLITSAGSKQFRGLAFSRIAFSTENPNLVVAATGAASGGITVGGEAAGVTRGLYYSTDAGQTWSYRTSVSDGSGTPDAGSSHSVVYFPSQHKFYAALRAHGIFSSADGMNWTRLATQPGGLNLTNCPTSPTDLNCPLYRAELAVVPGRNELYVWIVSSDDKNSGIFQTRDGGSSWTAVPSSAIAAIGTEVDQGTYNLSLGAIPNGTNGTDVYAGAVDQWKAILTDPATPSTWGEFMNLTHVYDCTPYGSYSHVHPDQHSIDFPYTHPAIIYFANDGGIYRTLNGYAAASGQCGSPGYPFDNLNRTMGSMTQFVWFSNHPTNAGTVLGGTQDNGSPATANGFNSQAWVSVNNGDGGYNTIDPVYPNTWYTSNNWVTIERCTNGASCTSGGFSRVIDTSKVSNDFGSFYTPYMLDPQNRANIIVGTCRVWRGNADGSSWTTSNALSYPNFSSAATGCPQASATNSVDNISALAAGGPKSVANDTSQVIWTGTEHGKVWITTNSDGGVSTWVNRTGAINPKNYPISSIALDPSDPSGQTAYVTIMGFDVSHVWRTVNAGQSWTDYTGDLPNAPADAVVVDPDNPNTVYVGTDVGVFATSNGGVNWAEVGLDGTGASTLPNVAITRMALFSGGTTQHLRVSTYGRGVWDIDLGTSTAANFTLMVNNPLITVNAGQSTTITGTLSPVLGYNSTVVVSCAGSAPATCTPGSPSYTVSGVTNFSVTVGHPSGEDFTFAIQAAGNDGTTHVSSVTVHVADFTLNAPSPASVDVPRGTNSNAVSVQIASAGQYSGTVNLTCAIAAAATGATCSMNPPSTQVSPTTAAGAGVTLTTVGATPAGTYLVTITATASGLPAKTQTFNLVVQLNPDFVLPANPASLGSVKATSTLNGTFNIAVQDNYTGTVSLSCVLDTHGTCYVPATVDLPTSNPVAVSVTPALVTGGTVKAIVSVTDGAKSHNVSLPFTAMNYNVQGPGTTAMLAGTAPSLSFTVASQGNYSGSVNTQCDVSAFAGATCVMTPPTPISVAADGTTTVTAAVTLPANVVGAHDLSFTATDVGQAALTHTTTAHLSIVDFSLGATPPTATIAAGGSTPHAITVTPAANSTASATVSFACAGLPQYSSCSFSPASQVVGSTPVSTGLTILTRAPSSARTAPAYGFWLPVAGLALLGVGGRRRGVGLLLLLIALCTLAIFQGCGGGDHKITTPGTPPGTYTVTVSGSVGSAERTTTVTLTVQ